MINKRTKEPMVGNLELCPEGQFPVKKLLDSETAPV